MQSTMMDFPLTLAPILRRAEQFFPGSEVVTRCPDRSLHRTNLGEVTRRARRLAEALTRAGLQRGDRVATLMWNHWAHLETYFGVPVAGGVVHTLNLRLHPAELAYIARHAGDRYLIVDDVLLPLLGKFRGEVPFERIFVFPFSGGPVPAGHESYEDLLATATGEFTLPQLDENDAAAMCYTSGTTGNPKGVVFSHRALALHTLYISLADAFGLSHHDTLLPVVPMFHVNAWGLPFVSMMLGLKQVFCGPHYDAESLLDLMAGERVTIAAGVPTVWMALLEALEKHPGRWPLQNGLRLIVGGAAAPEAMIRRFDALGVRVFHSWGMTEMTPAGTIGRLKRNQLSLPESRQYAARARQGLAFPFVEIRAMNESGEIPWDDRTLGELQVRGPCIASSYYNLPEERERWTADGWFRTGDVVTIDAQGSIKIADRTKDLIKSGGEWISSVEMESALMGHPAVKEAAVIALPHPKWLERPLACVVLRDGHRTTPEELRDFLAARFSRWQLPDGFEFVAEIPRTTTGKFLKKKLREQFASRSWE